MSLPTSLALPKTQANLQRSGLYFKLTSFGPGTLIQLRGKNLWYCKIMCDAMIESKELIHPTPTRWNNFWREMDRAGVWDWKPRYEDPEILDGNWWELRLRCGCKTVRSSGMNAYPGQDGATNSSSSQFESVCKALRRLCGGKVIG